MIRTKKSRRRRKTAAQRIPLVQLLECRCVLTTLAEIQLVHFEDTDSSGDYTLGVDQHFSGFQFESYVEGNSEGTHTTSLTGTQPVTFWETLGTAKEGHGVIICKTLEPDWSHDFFEFSSNPVADPDGQGRVCAGDFVTNSDINAGHIQFGFASVMDPQVQVISGVDSNNDGSFDFSSEARVPDFDYDIYFNGATSPTQTLTTTLSGVQGPSSADSSGTAKLGDSVIVCQNPEPGWSLDFLTIVNAPASDPEQMGRTCTTNTVTQTFINSGVLRFGFVNVPDPQVQVISGRDSNDDDSFDFLTDQRVPDFDYDIYFNGATSPTQTLTTTLSGVQGPGTVDSSGTAKLGDTVIVCQNPEPGWSLDFLTIVNTLAADPVGTGRTCTTNTVTQTFVDSGALRFGFVSELQDLISVTVSNINDSGPGSLRQAILDVNASNKASRIEFNIPGAAPHKIKPQSPLPAITTDNTIIDGTTEPNYSGIPVVGIFGDGAGSGTDGLRLLSDDSAVIGLAIAEFDGDGLEIIGGGNHVISKNIIGSLGVHGGNYNGMRIISSSGNRVDDNWISGNNRSGIFINSALQQGNTIVNNRIGTDNDGLVAVPNATDGITIQGANNQIGAVGQGNVISGNARWAVFTGVAGRGSNRIQANLLGVDATGTAALPNVMGVYIKNESNLVGGSVPGQANVISGNTAYGIAMNTVDASSNLVQGNLIGTSAAGTADLGNELFGVRITFAGNNTIGGLGSGEANTISGNDASGVLLAYAGTSNNQIIGNKIGTDPTGSVAIGNSQDGVRIVIDSTENHISGNQISGNGLRGVVVDGPGSSGNVVQENRIGTDETGTNPLHNGPGGAVRVLSPQTTIDANTISGPDTGVLAFRDAVDLVITDNLIGVPESGATTSLGMTTGIQFTSGANRATVAENHIANNIKGIVAASGTGFDIRNNSIHDNSAIGIDLGGNGATLNDAGDADSGANNLQNTPVLSHASLSGNQLTIAYRVDSTAQASAYPMTIEFFVSDGNGQGKTRMGVNVYSLAERRTVKTITLTVPGLNPGETLVATATDALGNTSEFGNDLVVS